MRVGLQETSRVQELCGLVSQYVERCDTTVAATANSVRRTLDGYHRLARRASFILGVIAVSNLVTAGATLANIFI